VIEVHRETTRELRQMTYVIGAPCIDVLDRACVEECPVDCIYEGERSLYINPSECIDCGACEPVCPVEAIFYEDDLPPDLEPFLADNADFFAVTLDGRSGPLGNPGGAAALGVVGADTELVATFPARVPPGAGESA
jgi:NAD-dependent dihydropyrimidine dehydrogenase PreA subunit